MDGHTTHTKKLEAIEFAQDRRLIILSLAVHTTRRLQPLDVSLFKPLMVYFNQASNKWKWAHPGSTTTPFQASELHGKSCGRDATVETAVSGFAKIGIWPTDP